MRSISDAAWVHVNRDLHFLIEPVEDRHQTVDREAAELGPANAGKIRRGNAGQIMSLAHAQLPGVEHLDNPGSQNRSELFKVRIGIVEITENITAAAHNFDGLGLGLSGHPKISLRRLSRARTKSISALGVLIPVLDFFRNAWITQMSLPR